MRWVNANVRWVNALHCNAASLVYVDLILLFIYCICFCMNCVCVCVCFHYFRVKSNKCLRCSISRVSFIRSLVREKSDILIILIACNLSAPHSGLFSIFRFDPFIHQLIDYIFVYCLLNLQCPFASMRRAYRLLCHQNMMDM